MYAKTWVAVALVCLVVVTAGPLHSSAPLELVNMIHLEEPCTLQGGMCFRIEDCPPDSRAHLDMMLCPQQQHLNVTCCYL